MGKKTTMVVSVEATMAPPTWAVPVITASLIGIPSSFLRKILSTTTIALSTSIPAPNTRPPSVIMLRVNPLKYIKLNVATTEMGMERLIMRVDPI